MFIYQIKSLAGLKRLVQLAVGLLVHLIQNLRPLVAAEGEEQDQQQGELQVQLLLEAGLHLVVLLLEEEELEVRLDLLLHLVGLLEEHHHLLLHLCVHGDPPVLPQRLRAR